MKDVNDLTREEIIILVQAHVLKLKLGIYCIETDELFESMRKSNVSDVFYKVCDLFEV